MYIFGSACTVLTLFGLGIPSSCFVIKDVFMDSHSTALLPPKNRTVERLNLGTVGGVKVDLLPHSRRLLDAQGSIPESLSTHLLLIKTLRLF